MAAYVGDYLMTQFNNGDTRAFTAIYDIHYPRIFGFVKRLVDNRQEAQEITADTFVKLWRLRANFETEEHVRSFLYVTARNASYDFLKYYSKEHQNQKEWLLQMPESDDVIARDEIKADVLDHLYMEIANLPQQCKNVFTLSYVEGLKNNEIADQLQISDKTVRNQKVLAKRLLREALFSHFREVSLLVLFTLAERLTFFY